MRPTGQSSVRGKPGNQETILPDHTSDQSKSRLSLRKKACAPRGRHKGVCPGCSPREHPKKVHLRFSPLSVSVSRIARAHTAAHTRTPQRTRHPAPRSPPARRARGGSGIGGEGDNPTKRKTTTNSNNTRELERHVHGNREAAGVEAHVPAGVHDEEVQSSFAG